MDITFAAFNIDDIPNDMSFMERWSRPEQTYYVLAVLGAAGSMSKMRGCSVWDMIEALGGLVRDREMGVVFDKNDDGDVSACRLVPQPEREGQGFIGVKKETLDSLDLRMSNCIYVTVKELFGE